MDERTLAALREDMEHKIKECNAASSTLYKARHQRIEEAIKAIDDALTPEKKRVAELNSGVWRATKAYDDAKVEAAKAEQSGLYQGTLIEWHRPDRSARGPWQPTGRTGRNDVWSRDSACPDNIKYSKPSPGDVYIRVLKKDGSPSSRFEKTGRWKSKWLPEGEGPQS